MEDAWKFNDNKDKRNLYISWTISLWCNFNCSYCFFPNHKRKQVLARYKPTLRNPLSFVKSSFTRNKFAHSFDNYPAKLWTNKIREIAKGRNVALKITGGEPFLDTENFHYVLDELINCENVDNIRVDTNGSFLIDNYRDLNLEKVFLNLSFHPEFITVKALLDKTKGFLDAGLNVVMVNYVMTPSQRGKYEAVREEFSKIGVSLNPGVYIDKKNRDRSEEEFKMYSKYLKDFDINNKMGLLDLKNNQICNFPQIGLNITPDGKIHNDCFDKAELNFLRSSKEQIERLLIEKPTKCPKGFCSQTNKYSFQIGCRRNHGSLNTLKSYVEDALIDHIPLKKVIEN